MYLFNTQSSYTMRGLRVCAGLVAVFSASAVPLTVVASGEGDVVAVVDATSHAPDEGVAQQNLVRQEESTTPLAKKPAKLLPLLIGGAILALISMFGSGSYIVQKLKEDKRVQELLEKYIELVYTTLTETYIIDDKLTQEEIQLTAKQFKNDILKEEQQIESLVKARGVDAGSIPLEAMTHAVKESMLERHKMHPRVEQKDSGARVIRYVDGKVVGVKDYIHRQLEIYYEVAGLGRAQPIVRLSNEEESSLVNELIPRVEQMVKSEADCAKAHLELSVEVRRRVNQKQTFDPDRKAVSVVDGPTPKFDKKKAEEVFTTLFNRWKAQKEDRLTVKEIPPSIWEQMVNEFMDMYNSEITFELECMKNNVDFSVVETHAMVHQIASSTLMQHNLVIRKPVKPKGTPEAEVLDQNKSDPLGSQS